MTLLLYESGRPAVVTIAPDQACELLLYKLVALAGNPFQPLTVDDGDVTPRVVD